MLSECEICGEEVSKIYRCESCEVLFCKDCGSTTDMICSECSWEPEEEED